jgi:DNA-binding transcriptional MerR regulator
MATGNRMKKKLYKTRDICRLFDISKATLFRWEKEGLISSVGRDWRNWRIYSDRTVGEIKQIIKKRNQYRDT